MGRHEKKVPLWLVAARYLQSIKTFWLSNWISIAGVVAPFPQVSCAGALPQELGHWFCSQNLRLSSGIAFGSDYQMTCRGSNFDSNLNFAAWPLGLEVLSALKPQNNPCGVWILFRSAETLKSRTAVSRYQPSSTRLPMSTEFITAHMTV